MVHPLWLYSPDCVGPRSSRDTTQIFYLQAPILNVPYVHGTTYQDDFNSATDTFLFNVIVTDSDPDTCAILSDPTKFTIDSSSPPSKISFFLSFRDLSFFLFFLFSFFFFFLSFFRSFFLSFFLSQICTP